MKKAVFRAIHRVALYLRVSTAEQAQGHSLDSQRNALTAWAAKEGWEVVAVHEDPGASGTSVTGRPGFQRIIADAQAGKFDAILVLKVDRFARNVRDSSVYREVLADCGVRLRSLTEPTLEDEGPASFLTQGMFDLQAEFYSRLLSHNVARGMATRAQKGLSLGDPPFGYSRPSALEPLQIVPHEAEAVRRCFQDYAAGTASMAELADYLNAAGFQPRSKQGRVFFSKATVRGMVSNPTYAGDVHHHGEVVARDRTNQS